MRTLSPWWLYFAIHVPNAMVKTISKRRERLGYLFGEIRRPYKYTALFYGNDAASNLGSVDTDERRRVLQLAVISTRALGV